MAYVQEPYVFSPRVVCTSVNLWRLGWVAHTHSQTIDYWFNGIVLIRVTSAAAEGKPPNLKILFLYRKVYSKKYSPSGKTSII